jgi:hypothetical protein
VLALRKGPLSLDNRDLDTGQPPDEHANPLVAETNAEFAELRAAHVGP